MLFWCVIYFYLVFVCYMQPISNRSGKSAHSKPTTTQLVGNLLFRTLVPSAFAYISRDRHMEITVPLAVFSIIPWAIQDFKTLQAHLVEQKNLEKISKKTKNQSEIEVVQPKNQLKKGILENFITKDAFLQTTSVISSFYGCYPVTDLFVEPRWLVGKKKPSSLVSNLVKDWNNNPSHHMTGKNITDYLSYFGLSFFVYWAMKDNAIAPTINRYIAPLFFSDTSSHEATS